MDMVNAYNFTACYSFQTTLEYTIAIDPPPKLVTGW